MSAGTSEEASAFPDSSTPTKPGGDALGVPTNGRRDGSMDGLLHAYSKAAGSPQSPTLGQPGKTTCFNSAHCAWVARSDCWL